MPSTTSIDTDFLIVGQGLAGSLLAWFLSEKGKGVHIIDPNHESSSSIVAAGIINPITGRRLVKSWMIDTLLPFAQATYEAIEKKLSCKLYQSRTIFRALPDIAAENQWDERSLDPAYQNYMSTAAPAEEVRALLKSPFSWGAIRGAGQVDLPCLLKNIRKYFDKQKAVRSEVFDYDALTFPERGGIQYKNIQAKHLVFCEGHKARFNPFFRQLPFVVSKGEMLEIEMEMPKVFPIIKHRVYLAPLPSKRLWIGATYEWEHLNDTCTASAKNKLLALLDRSLDSPYTVHRQVAAIRPTVKDRRPFLGTHPEYPYLHIFNGLGTKGTSLAPYWASRLAAYLTEEKPLDTIVNIGRFISV